jgi:hypothetical protein
MSNAAPHDGGHHDDAWIGRLIEGRYRVLARVGAGGMGVIYRVEHARLHKVAAMKVLLRELAGHPGAVQRFRREVELVSRLDHPHVVQTFDCGHCDGQLYLIMEYVRGENLGELLYRDGPLPAAQALTLAIQVCAALEEAHDAGIIHCDLKPDNIVCVRHRQGLHAKVLDFGLAKLRAGAPVEASQTAAFVAGTPEYMAPEQVRSERVDPRTDLYSLGATLYGLLTGRPPHAGGSPFEVMSRHLTDDPVPPSRRAPWQAIPTSIDRVVLRAMARDRHQRYQTATAMRVELQAALERLPERTSPRGLSTALDPAELSAEALDREDLRAFERRMRWRRLLRAAVVAPVAVACVALAGWAGATALRPGPAVEREPNDTPAVASELVRGGAVSGRIAATHLDGRPDFDCYRIPPGAGARTFMARITPVAGVDLVLELFDDRGRLVERANHAPAGGGERLGPVVLGPGEAFLRARPVWTEGEPPTTSATAPYALTAWW